MSISIEWGFDLPHFLPRQVANLQVLGWSPPALANIYGSMAPVKLPSTYVYYYLTPHGSLAETHCWSLISATCQTTQSRIRTLLIENGYKCSLAQQFCSSVNMKPTACWRHCLVLFSQMKQLIDCSCRSMISNDVSYLLIRCVCQVLVLYYSTRIYPQDTLI
jgi:hypothetical protein